MAASCVRIIRTALTGMHLAPGRLFPSQLSRTPTVCQRLQLHVSPAASLCSSSAEPKKSTQTNTSAKAQEMETEDIEGPEYIPRRKAKNPMMKIGYAWMIGLPTGIIGFILAKRQVDKNRLKQLKIRQRMKQSNEGDYEGSRYRHHAKEPKLDQ
ncbi:DUF4748 domain-containing protein [Melanotaenia boesemani]|uniref:DUF4748 domain-containing protein n=1 Tax=Melanotaenia boesemani TaxID=1250792 RepID=UPI001C04F857|nr:DUF4748 domain-containing protein [Melanotaenia boesemani]